MQTRKVFDGVVDVCAHRVSFWYDTEGQEVTEELTLTLTEEAECRAQACIIQGCVSGDLNCLHNGETEIRGWWQIERG